ncbi:putative lipopolysaccharide biosynthesis domain protein, partial [Vibrio parahaemolyticus EKP-028]
CRRGERRTKKNRFSQPTLFIVGADRRRGGCDSPVTDCVAPYS